MHLPRQNATHKHALMYKTAGVYSTVKIVKRLNRTVFCNKPTELQGHSPSWMWSAAAIFTLEETPLTWVFVGLETACGVCVCVCLRFPLQFSSVVLIQRITPDWTALSWTLPLKPCHHTLCIFHPSSLSLSLSVSTLALLLLLLLYSPSLASPAHCVFRSASVFLSTEDNHIPEEGRHMAGKRHTLLSVRLYVPMCVVAWTITPIVFPEGWANKQGVGVGGRHIGVGCSSRKN